MKKETFMKKSESAHILGTQNQVKRKVMKTVSNCDKKNTSKS